MHAVNRRNPLGSPHENPPPKTLLHDYQRLIPVYENKPIRFLNACQLTRSMRSPSRTGFGSSGCRSIHSTPVVSIPGLGESVVRVMSRPTRLTLTDDATIRRHAELQTPIPGLAMRSHVPGAGENPRIAIAGAAGTGRSHVEDGHVKNEQLMTVRDIDDHDPETTALVHCAGLRKSSLSADTTAHRSHAMEPPKRASCVL